MGTMAAVVTGFYLVRFDAFDIWMFHASHCPPGGASFETGFCPHGGMLPIGLPDMRVLTDVDISGLRRLEGCNRIGLSSREDHAG
jgi:hypothetical protein